MEDFNSSFIVTSLQSQISADIARGMWHYQWLELSTFLGSSVVTTFRLVKGGCSRVQRGKSAKKSRIQKANPTHANQALQSHDALTEEGFSISSPSTRSAVPGRLEDCQSMHRRRFVCKQNKQPWLNSCNQLSNNSQLRKQHIPAPCLILNSCFLSCL